MVEQKLIDYKAERDSDVEKIKNSSNTKKVIVAGPGTGKSFLFEQVIKKMRLEGKKRFLAITFVGKLGDYLSDDLAGLAETMTLHGFARQFMLRQCPTDWKYYPKMKSLIKEDLETKGIVDFQIGDENYKKRTGFYKAVGEDDVIYYAVQICKKDNNKIPKYDLILVDEFQDFNEIESEFIDLLAQKNEIMIVGDDDQALYGFKGSSPKYIRDKYDPKNTDFESHTLRFCSRCTEVIINSFHNIVNNFKLNTEGSGRIKKEYKLYIPDKKIDSELNPKIVVLRGVKSGSIPYKIKNELDKLLGQQKIKSVLIIGEGQSCQTLLSNIANKLRWFGFNNVDYNRDIDKPFSIRQEIIDSYKFLSFNTTDPLAWRLLIATLLKENEWKEIVSNNFDNSDSFINSIPEKIKREQLLNSNILNKILNKPSSSINAIAESTFDKFKDLIVLEKRSDRKLLVNQLVSENKTLARPLVNLDITVCTILGSKGLGADVVFLVGFDQGKLPSKESIKESEIYQMLVALTRAKKRIFFVNTQGCSMSKFIDSIDNTNIEEFDFNNE